ncbi:MAG: glycogen synthase [Mycoplasmatales bacterium]
MKIAFATAEALPYEKRGGLADVIEGLAVTLAKLKFEVTVFMPKYRSIIEQNLELETLGTSTLLGNYVGYETIIYNDVRFIFIDNQDLFNRDEVYGYDDDGYRFGFFSKALTQSFALFDDFPDVVHLNDWHTGLTSACIKAEAKEDERYEGIRTVFTIHNLMYQGVYELALQKYLELPESNDYELYGNFNFMKTAIVYSDLITTVSQTYCEETLTEQFGFGLETLLKTRYDNNEYLGILNGVNYQLFSPEADESIKQQYDVNTYIQGKLENKQTVLKDFELSSNLQYPLITIITRLTTQKGLEMIVEEFHQIIRNNINFVVMGIGEDESADFFREMAQFYPNFAFIEEQNEKLAHQLYAASDFFLMPSVFEPCGLTQIISMKYGAIPIVHAVGGLKDTVRNYDFTTQLGTGFTFEEYTADNFLKTLAKATDLYWKKAEFNKLVKQAMLEDFSWEKSIQEYIRIYEEKEL